ncbi:hypothetical protein H4219_000960 [Mycoemilia scoparia]|uniref:Uncharacterized protein n=1 Tax=Mycoemilia scoparia TaxID=417184 RepID=A0A9W8DSJ4_9FUNG|nr:hypothetical protein H4219_000960 [Mycoemilia scoparia]
MNCSDLLLENIQLRDQFYREIYEKDPPPRDSLFSELEAAVLTNHKGMNNLFPLIQDTSELELMEDRLEQAQADIVDLEQQRDRIEFQYNNMEEDWQIVQDTLRKIAHSGSPSEIMELLDKPLDNIVGDEPQAAWQYVKDIIKKTTRSFDGQQQHSASSATAT